MNSGDWAHILFEKYKNSQPKDRNIPFEVGSYAAMIVSHNPQDQNEKRHVTLGI